jgi:hypothetical protein
LKLTLQMIPGMTLGTLLHLLQRNRLCVNVCCLHRLAYLIGWGAVNSFLRRLENLTYGDRIEKVRIQQPPLFIIGHWRSGTTHLHNLLSLDQNLASPNSYQAMFPWHFLSSERFGRWIFNFLAPKKRPMDNMVFRADVPQEDELALAALSLASPYLRLLFPASEDNRSAGFDPLQLRNDALQSWKSSFEYFVKKLSYLNNKRLVLKSPPHTGRIRILLDMFPEAQFVHIVRNPYEVYFSTRKLWDSTLLFSHLQKFDAAAADESILTSYSELFSLFERDRNKIPSGNLYELKFEDLERHPQATLQQLYQALSLTGFESFWTKAQGYLESIKAYRKNRYRMDEKGRQRVRERWQWTFDHYGYAA